MSDWTWALLDAQGAPAGSDLGGQVFPTQSEAESWLGEEWRGLLDAGVDAVTLHEDGAVVYGPMSLHPTQ
ncbi:hypothetical protein [Lapillicoccus jejuensis]|uniref:Uncharacterized protein n=1 Tax=Lapillicoccus jejuensis TaxID=402171 RepID=A0A542E5R5_9MICO|nr:hypothetical protein [Lapillicoccus jejuensis]TQJ10678.1 hypothetical protein FB458_3807 [Lapillicoccus jejuensis]